MRTGNPTLNANTFENFGVYRQDATAAPADAMTINGTAQKTFFLLVLALGSACFTWSRTFRLVEADPSAAIGSVAPWVFGGAFEAQYPGIVIQAVGGTFGTLACLLLAYQSGLIRATENFKLGIVAATGGIALLYLVTFIAGLFGFPLFSSLFGSGMIGIGFSVVVVSIAALNLVLDFDFIEQAAARGAPKYLEWYGAFALMVTLVWLYLEILRLLAKLNDRR